MRVIYFFLNCHQLLGQRYLFLSDPCPIGTRQQNHRKKKFCLKDTANETAYLMVHQVSTYSATEVEGSLIISFFGGKEIIKNLRNIMIRTIFYILEIRIRIKIRW